MTGLIERLFTWMLRKIGVRRLLALSLMFTVQISVAYGLDTAIRRLPDYYLVNAAIAGVLIGWPFGSRWKFYWAAPAVLALVVAWNLIAASRTGGLLFRIAATATGLLFKGLPWKVDWTPLVDLFLLFTSSMQAVLVDINRWLLQAAAGNFGFSQTTAAFFWGMGCMLCAAWGSWWLQSKRQPLPAVIPGGLLLAAVLNYSRAPVLSLVIFLGSILMLLALENYAARENHWQTNQLDFSEELRVDLAVAAISLSLGLSVLAGMVPSLSIEPLVTLARRVAPSPQNQPLAESLGLRSGPGGSGEPLALGSGGMPRQHLLGGGSELSRQLIFTASTDDPPLASSEGFENPQPPRYYWQSLIYDIYTGQGWQSSPTTELSYPPGALTIEQPATPGRYLVQRINGAVDLNGLLYTAGMPLAADLPVQGLWRTPPEAGQSGDWFAFTISSNRYQAVSWVASAGGQDLRRAADRYPEEIVTRYTQLPEDLPERVRQLSGRLVQDQPTVYDRALAIESYLRRYPYTLDLPDPPRDRDLVDYFLFELQQGYCDYYATAMVVLSRSAGIPARLVTGYASGTYDTMNARYRVVEADAHSWPELFFPGFGWIEFEPTGGLSPIERPEEIEPSGVASQAPELPEQAPAPASTLDNILEYITHNPGLAAILVLLLIFAAGLVVYYLRIHSASAEQTIAHMLIRLKLQAQRLEVETPAGQTAHELALSLQQRLKVVQTGSLWDNVLSPCQDELETWAQSYARSAYGPPPTPEAIIQQTISSWRKLRWRLWLARYIRTPRGDDPTSQSE